MNDALRGAMGEIDRIKLMMPSIDLAQEALRQTGMLRPEFSQAMLASSQYLRELSDQFKSLYQPPILNALQSDWSAILSRDVLSSVQRDYQRGPLQHATLLSPALAEFNATRSSLVAQNRAIFSEMQADLSRNRELLAPFLQAQDAWLRTAHFPSSLTDWRHIADTARGLASHIADSWAAAHQAVAPAEEDEEGALRLAEERFSEILDDKNPRTMLSALRHFFDQIVPELPRALHKLLYEVIVILLSHLIYNTAISPVLYRHAEHPAIAKEIRSEAKRLQRAQVLIPADARVVIASQLVVHCGPNQRSRQVGRLYAGDIVSVERVKTRSWSLVVYEDASGESAVRGWIFSRYIKRLSGGPYSSCSMKCPR